MFKEQLLLFALLSWVLVVLQCERISRLIQLCPFSLCVCVGVYHFSSSDFGIYISVCVCVCVCVYVCVLVRVCVWVFIIAKTLPVYNARTSWRIDH
jgi:hypothetical protein